MVTTDDIKQLRDETSVSIMQCKKALEEAGGDKEKAKVILRKHSSAIASKKSDRELGAGVVSAYSHSGGQVVGVVVLACETDFVAKNEAFGTMAHDIAMQVAAMNPQFTSRDDVKDSDLIAAKAVFTEEAANVPEERREQAVQGKIDSYLRERVLLEQSFVKNNTITIRELIDQSIQKFGERVEILRFERFSVR